jgi:ankyrin repeat protein
MQQLTKTFNAEMEAYDVDLDLLQAVEENDLDGVKNALILGAEPNCIDKDGRTPLNAAVLRGHDIIALELINVGAMVNAFGTPSLTPLRAAMKGGHLSSVELMLAEGADTHTACPDKEVGCDMPDYIYAEKYCGPEIAALVSAVSNRKWLLDAVREDRDSQVEECLKKGTPADTEIEPGVTCLLFAARQGFAKTAIALLAHGADPQKAGPDGKTPMHAAAVAKSVEIIEALAEKGGTVYARDTSGKTPFSDASGRASEALQRCAEREVQYILRPVPVSPMPLLRFRPKV